MPRRFTLTLLGTLILTACNLPLRATGTPQPQPGPASAIPATATPPVLTIETVLALPTATFNVQPTSTPRLALASASDQPVNCRYGPGTAYAVIGALDVGRQAEVVGQSADAQWWQVRNPDDPSTLCWLSAGVVQVTGNAAAAPVVNAPPAQVTRIELRVEPAALNVACNAFPQYVTAAAEIFTNGPTTVSWQWETSEGEVFPKDPLLFLEAGSQTVRLYYTVKAARDYWVQARSLTPNDLANRAVFKATCVP